MKRKQPLQRIAMNDQKQRDLALDPTQSFIVQAPAGSGKTELLTQRFLCLLATVNEPEEILAITFTKKASSEMRSRIRDALQRAEHSPKPETAHELKTWTLAKAALAKDREHQWGLLANPNRLRIKTIDAFNTLLTRQMPLLSLFGAQPDISDLPKAIYREAVQSFLSHLEEDVEWSKAIAELLLHLDNNMKKAEELLVEMLAKRDQWLPDIMAHQNHPDLRRHLEANLAELITEQLGELAECFPEDCQTELLELLRYARSQLRASETASPLLAGEDLTSFPGNEVHEGESWKMLSKLLLTEAGTYRKKIDVRLGFPAAGKSKTPENLRAAEYKNRLLEMLEHLSSHEKLEASLAELQFLPEATYTERQWQIIQALHQVLKMLVAQLAVCFKQAGKIDYTENAQAALIALGSEDAPTDLALVLDYQMKHILVDEFQDTSNNQYSLLEKLVNGWQPGDGRSLFLVGDPMQSIYRFREADVGLFIRARIQGIGPIPLTALTLSVNFRSTAPLVHWINDHFDKVMPAYDDIASGAVSYTPSTAKSADTESPNGKLSVELTSFVDAEPEILGSALVNLIHRAQENDPEGSIAILVRSRSHLRHLIPALKNAGLPYQALEIDPLKSKPIIQDLLALTRALLYPADRLAWLALLRSPCCGLTLNDLLQLAGTDRNEALWEKLEGNERFQTLSADGQVRLGRVLPILLSSLRERQREEVHLWVEKTWLALGGPATAHNESELRDAKIFFALLKKLVQNHSNSKVGLPWETLEESIEKLYAQANSASSIQIMTIHNAKGLEFDTVILPHLEKGSGKSDKELLTFMQRPLGNNSHALILAPLHGADEEADSTYKHIQRQDNNKTRHENGRLLYVAATRAKKSLHLLLSLKTNSKGELSPPTDSSMLKKLWPSVEAKLQHQASQVKIPVNQSKKPQLLKRLSTHWKNPLELSLTTERPAHNTVQGFHLRQTDAQAMGTVIHRLLQELAIQGVAWWQTRSAQQQATYIQSLLIDAGVLPGQSNDLIAKVKLAIENTLNDPRGRWILEQKEAETELALTGVFSKGMKQIVIDRTFVDENQLRWIIDYKTSVPSADESQSSFLAREQEKYREQLQHYSQALSGLDSCPIRLGLYFPLISAWVECNY